MAKKPEDNQPEAADTTFADLVAQKIRAGLSKADAEEVAKRQIEHDAALAKAAAPSK